MHATIRAFWLPKRGSRTSEYEDAYWPKHALDLAMLPIRLAVGDGATEASFSALWARLLVREYGRGRLAPDSLPERLDGIQSRWNRHVQRKPLSWYAEQKAADGAFSSLLGLTIHESTNLECPAGMWEAFAIGDSCLFQVRAKELIKSFPLECTAQFNSRPHLISSVANRNTGLEEVHVRTSGDWRLGDVFYLMTDALACWFLKSWEMRNNSLSLLDEVESQSRFEKLIDEQRADPAVDDARMLKNDDVTLVRCNLNHCE